MLVPVSYPEYLMTGNPGWCPSSAWGSSRLSTYHLHTQQICVKGPGHRRQTRKYSSYTSRFVFNAMTSDHSVPQTWFSPNPLSGNANVFLLSFWLISEMHGWKDWLGSHFFDANRIEKIFPQLHTSHLSIPATCHSAAGRGHYSKAGKGTTKAGYERERKTSWEHENQRGPGEMAHLIKFLLCKYEVWVQTPWPS